MLWLLIEVTRAAQTMTSGEQTRARDLAGNLTLLVVSTLIALLLAEFVFRGYTQLQWLRAVKWYRNELQVMLPDDPIEYALLPGVSRDNLIPKTGVTWRYAINADGFRGEDFNVESDRARVLFLGDSYTFGWAVQQDEVLPLAVERVLARPPFSLDISAYNLGVPGYNTVQESHLLARVVDRYSPALVVLGYVMNDAQPQQNVHERPAVRYQYVSSWLLAFIKERINDLFFGGEAVLHTGLNVPDTDFLAALRENQPKWVDGQAAFTSMAALCKHRNIPLLLVVFPSYNYPFDDRYPYRAIHAAVMAWARDQGVDAVDLLPQMEGRNFREYRVKGDGHPNGRAFEEAARLLAPVIYRMLEHGRAPY